MAASRTVTALAGLAASLAISAAIYLVTGSLLVFVFVPFVPFLFSRSPGEESPGADRPPPRECPECGFRARNPHSGHSFGGGRSAPGDSSPGDRERRKGTNGTNTNTSRDPVTR